MGRRMSLHKILTDITENVYFSPPPEFKMDYPCIVYQRARIHSRSADNIIYGTQKEYQLTVIDRDPDSSIVDEVSELPRCLYDRHFVTSNLNHDVFSIIF